MQVTEGSMGRVFVIRLEHGDPMPEALEQLAAEKGVRAGMAILVGGADDGSRLVIGPEDGAVLPPIPVVAALAGVHEVAGVGVLVPDDKGRPMLHMHAACGRGENTTTTGCIRAGIATWHVLEVVLIEILGVDAARLPDAKTGFHLLQCVPRPGA